MHDKSENLVDTTVETVYRLDSTTVDFMVKHLIADRLLILESLEYFNLGYFSHDERAYRVIINGIKLYMKTVYKDLTLTAEIFKTITIDDDEMRGGTQESAHLKQNVFQIIDEAFSVPKDNVEANRHICREVIQRFLTERGIHDKLYSHFSKASSVQSVSKDPSVLLGHFSKIYSNFKGAGSSAMCESMPAVWKPNIAIGAPMGIPYFDKFMTGGVAAGDIYGLLAGTGAGKTWMGINIIANHCFTERAREILCLAEGRPYKRKLGVYANYEGSIDSIRLRLAATVSKTPLNTIKAHIINGALLSTKGNLKDYEIKRYSGVVEEALRISESDRFNDTRSLVNTYVQLLDMSGSGGTKLGHGYTSELTAQVDKLVNFKNVEIALIVVDYVKLIVDRFISAKGIKVENMRHYIRKLAEDISVNIGLSYNCCVWLLHQLSGESNSIKAHKPLHHSMASECKDFAENCHRMFCVGQKDLNSGCQRLDATKYREDEHTSKNCAVIKFEADSCTYSLNNEWVIDEQAGFIRASFSGSSMDVPTSRSYKAASDDYSDRDS